MGAWVGRVNCFYISWKRSFHSPVELDLTPTWPILWSSDRVTAPQPATHLTFFEPTHLPFGQSEQSEMKQLLLFFIISLQFLLDQKNNQTGLNTDIISNKIFQPCNFRIVVALFPFWAFPLVTIGCRQSCRLFWFGEAEAGTCASKHVFTKSFIDSGYPKHPMPELGETCYSRQGPDMNWKYGYMHGLRLRSMDSEFPSVRWDSGWNSALQTTEKIRHNTSCSGGEAQDESEMSIEFTLRARIQHVCLNIK